MTPTVCIEDIETRMTSHCMCDAGPRGGGLEVTVITAYQPGPYATTVGRCYRAVVSWSTIQRRRARGICGLPLINAPNAAFVQP